MKNARRAELGLRLQRAYLNEALRSMSSLGPDATEAEYEERASYVRRALASVGAALDLHEQATARHSA